MKIELNQIKQHLSKDKVLEPIMNLVNLPKIESTNNVFNDIISCILEQQIHYRSTKKIFLRMLAKADLKELTIKNIDQFEEFGMRDYKISMKKLESMDAVITYFKKNSHNWQELSDSEIRKILSQIQGIGDWTVDMILMYTLGRKNVFPHGDFHLKNVMSNLYDIKSRFKSNMIETAKHWEPFSSFATLYLLEFKKKKM